MKGAGAQLERYRQDPVGFARDVLRFESWSKQREILESVRDHRRTAVRSAHGVGKTAVAARVVLWWLAVWPDSVVITTSATWNQVREQLWREIAVAFHSAGGFINGTLSDARLELGAGWFALGLSTDTPERFAGYHADRLLVVLDEASGVHEAVWEAAETLITTPGSALLAIGNPTRTSGAFYRAFSSERALYNLVQVSAFDSPAVTGERVSEAVGRRLVSREWIESRRSAWGEGSPLWQVRVLGEFPTTSDDQVCSLADVEAAMRRSVEPGVPVIVSCDVARFGSDETVIALRRGDRVRIVKSYVGRDLMQTVGEITRVAREATRFGRPLIVVDDDGVGGGVTDRLRELGEFGVRPFNAARTARQRDDFVRRRDEAWFQLSSALPRLDLPARDEQLAADLVAPTYKVDSSGRLVVEQKSDTKRRLGRSPDRGDAVVMAFSIGSSSVSRAAAEVAEPLPEVGGRGWQAIRLAKREREQGLAEFGSLGDGEPYGGSVL